MEDEEFEEFSRQMTELLALCHVNMKSYCQSEVKRCDDVHKGYLREILGDQPPSEAASFSDFTKEVEEAYLSKVASCKHPLFNAFYPLIAPSTAVLARAMETFLSSVTSNWKMNPALYEMEMLMCDWFAGALGLPQKFCYTSQTGGGIILSSATEGLLMAATAARNLKMPRDLPEETSRPRFVMYTSDQGHSCVGKVGVMIDVIVRAIPSHDDGAIDVTMLAQTIRSDKGKGLVPFMVQASVGTAGVCAFDNLRSINLVCKEEDIWVHVDACYAGNFCMCPEFRYLLDGVDDVDSIVISPQKGNMASAYTSCLWMTNRFLIEDKLVEENTMMGFLNLGDRVQFHHSTKLPNYFNMMMPTAKTAGCLQLFFAFKLEGLDKLQQNRRRIVDSGEAFQKLLQQSEEIEIVKEATLGLVGFKLKGENERSIAWMEKIKNDNRILLQGLHHKGAYIIRFVATLATTDEHLNQVSDIIKSLI